LPLLSDDEFDGTLLNALHVAKEKYAENVKVLLAEAGKPGTSEGARHHYQQLSQQFDKQHADVIALIDKLEEGSEDA
jgi:hypothetical protein